MSDDIVERIRNVGRDYDFHENALIYEAAGKIERLLEHIAQQQLDIVTLGQEVGRLREALQWYVDNDDTNEVDPENAFWIAGRDRARAALGEEKK